MKEVQLNSSDWSTCCLTPCQTQAPPETTPRFGWCHRYVSAWMSSSGTLKPKNCVSVRVGDRFTSLNCRCSRSSSGAAVLNDTFFSSQNAFSCVSVDTCGSLQDSTSF